MRTTLVGALIAGTIANLLSLTAPAHQGKSLPRGVLVNRIDRFSVVDLSSHAECRPNKIVYSDLLHRYAKSQAHAKWSVLVNGSFTEYGPSIVPLMHAGKLTNVGVNRAWRRGGIARLESGKVKLCFLDSPAPEVPDRLSEKALTEVQGINRSCGEDNDRVLEFMGGAYLFVRDGKRVSWTELEDGVQKGNPYSFDSPDQTLLAEKNGRIWAIQTDHDSGLIGYAAFQDAMLKAGFNTAIKFDGSSGFFRAVHKENGKVSTTGRSSGCIGLIIQNP